MKQRWSVGGQRESARNSLSSAVASSTDRSISKPSRSRAWQHRPRPLRLPSRSAEKCCVSSENFDKYRCFGTQPEHSFIAQSRMEEYPNLPSHRRRCRLTKDVSPQAVPKPFSKVATWQSHEAGGFLHQQCELSKVRLCIDLSCLGCRNRDKRFLFFLRI